MQPYIYTNWTCFEFKGIQFLNLLLTTPKVVVVETSDRGNVLSQFNLIDYAQFYPKGVKSIQQHNTIYILQLN